MIASCCYDVKYDTMTLAEVLQQVRVGDAFYRSAKPDILYERIGTLIERDGLGWATLKYGNGYVWDIFPERSNTLDNSATDWTLQRDDGLKDFDPKARQPKLRPNVTERTRQAWTYYDQMESPVR